MKKEIALSLAIGAALAGALGANPAVACTPTGFIRDGMDLTAKVIATGDIVGQTIDANGCNIGIYYGPGASGVVESSDVSRANYFGIVVTGEDSLLNVGTTSVDVTSSKIHDIGEMPFNGTQHGVAVYYYAFFIITPSRMARAPLAQSPAMWSPAIRKAESSRMGRMPGFRSARIRLSEMGRSRISRRTGSRSASAATV